MVAKQISYILLLSCFVIPALSQTSVQQPSTEKLEYSIEWHLINAGVAQVQETRSIGSQDLNLKLESAGPVNRLYRVFDTYHVQTDTKACPLNTLLNAQEGKRRAISKLTFDSSRRKVSFNYQDLVKNTTTQKELDAPPCTREIMSALLTLRSFDLSPGKSTTIPITDGKKVVSARVEAQAHETLEWNNHKYNATRYEAFLFDNVLYRRKGRLLIWIADDGDHVPVQVRLQLGFPIGNVLVQLQKQTRQ